MSFRKFGQNDVIVNTMRTHPKSEFFIYDGKVYINNEKNSAVKNYAGSTVNLNNVKKLSKMIIL